YNLLVFILLFFFQAEDGIRDATVTGVQTCALPIYSQLNDEEKLVRQTAREFVENEVIPVIEKHSREATFPMHLIPQLGELGFFRSEERRVGKEGRSGCSEVHDRKYKRVVSSAR